MKNGNRIEQWGHAEIPLLAVICTSQGISWQLYGVHPADLGGLLALEV
jgi:hypothetical protein